MTLIDRVGRKMLLLVGTAVCLAIVATQQYQALLVWALVAYIAFFAISQGAVVWVYISEIFPTRVRGKRQSLGSGTHWIMNAALSWMFPVIAARSGAYPFVFFSAMMVMQFVVVLLFFPDQTGIAGRAPAAAENRLKAVIRQSFLHLHHSHLQWRPHRASQNRNLFPDERCAGPVHDRKATTVRRQTRRIYNNVICVLIPSKGLRS